MERDIYKYRQVKCLLFILLILSFTAIQADDQQTPDTAYFAQASCEAVIQVFERFADSIWPGYDLSRQPFIWYFPQEWVLLFNYGSPVEGFISYPADWPSLSTHAVYYDGAYPGLMGQLAFYFEIDTASVAAVPVSDTSLERNFTFIAHECFHQYQYHNFNEIPWEREEKYPTMDTLNTALAALEMHVLADAVKAAANKDRDACVDKIKEFLAVRNHRWNRATAYLLTFEKGKEISEGTAKYVELKSLSYLEKIKDDQGVPEFDAYLQKRVKSYDMADQLLQEYQDRLTNNTLSPDNVARNRIYFVGNAQCFLMDFLGMQWKSRCEHAERDFTYSHLFEQELNIDTGEYVSLAAEAQNEYDFDTILATTGKLISSYFDGYRKALEVFEKQPGYRIEISFDTRTGISRSRRSHADKWLVENGRIEIREHFNVYVLKSDNMTFELHDASLMEENLWDDRIKTVILYSADPSLTLDGKSFDLKRTGEYKFNKVQFEGDNFSFQTSTNGRLDISSESIRIQLY